MGRRRGKKKFHHKIRKGKKDSNSMSSDSSTSPPPPWIELPRDVTANILRRLGPVDILENTQRVCTTWRSVCREPSLWRVIDMKIRDESREIIYNPDTICRLAVDRSQGELLDISIEHFGGDDLLCYISDRSSLLKCLRLRGCECISGPGLTTAIKNIPELEELQLVFMPQITASDIEAIGISCPKLKSFTFNNRWFKFPLVETDDSYAMAIAKSMPNLRHLQLFGNKLTEQGLEAILDGCPRLESLDLRRCLKIYFHGDLEERCVNRIKDVKLPGDSTDDYEWDDRIYIDEDDVYNGYSDDMYSYGDYEDYYEDYEGYGNYGFYEKYDDYTNPYNDLPFPNNLVWYMDDYED